MVGSDRFSNALVEHTKRAEPEEPKHTGSHENTRTHTMLNLLSDESDEEQDAQHVYSPCCRNGLYIAHTKLAGSDGGRLPFRDLFASKSLGVGAFVGFYTGDWYTPEKLESMPDVRRRNECR